MCTYVFMCVYACASMCKQRPDIRSRCLPQSFLTLVFERKSLIEPEDQLYGLASESQGSCVSASLALELQACLTFLSGCWG